MLMITLSMDVWKTQIITIQVSNMLKYVLLSFKIILLQSLRFKLSKKCKSQQVHKIIYFPQMRLFTLTLQKVT